MYHDYSTLSRCVREGEESFRTKGYDPKCPYRDKERSHAWHRGVFRADHASAGRTNLVMDRARFMDDLIREMRLSGISIAGFSGEY